MNILSHPYITYRVTGRLNPDLIAGSHLPDLVPFVPNSVFTFQEIHEGGEFLYHFLEKNNPQKIDLALGMMSHSVKFGADKFNNEIEKWLFTENKKEIEQLADKIVRCSGVSFKIARESRIHGYLWAGIDVYLQDKEKEFVEKMPDFHKIIDWEKVEEILSKAFGKPIVEVKRMVDFMVKPIKPEYFLSLSGLVKIWKSSLAGLPEGDKIEEQKTKELFEEIYYQFENKWEIIINKVLEDTKERMIPYLI